MKHRNQFLPLLAFLAFATTAWQTTAADVNFIALVKSQSFEQDELGIPSLSGESGQNDLMGFQAYIAAAAPGSVLSASVTTPQPAMHNLAQNEDGFGFEAFFEEKVELDENYGNGSYMVSIVTQNDGTQNVTINFPGDDYPNVPRISNYAAAQTIDSTSNFTLTWDPFDGGTTDDYVELNIETSDENTVFRSPDFGEMGSLNGTSASVQIDADALSPGQVYTAKLAFFRFGVPNTSYVLAFSTYMKETRFEIRTTGGTDSQAPGLERATPHSGRSNVEDNSIIAFQFTEAMKKNVDFGQAIQWMGVTDPVNNFLYSWNAAGDILFCNYTPGLPTDTQISWTLNPAPPMMMAASGPGSGASQISKQGTLAPRFEDLAGNPLSADFTQLTGDFTTANVSNTGEDVLNFKILKGEVFFQEGATVEPADLFFFELNAELNGFNTVSSIVLTPPGRAPVTIEPDYGGDSIEAEAEWAEKTDLDAFAPNGAYTLDFTTFHDGSPSATLTLNPDSYPNTPTIQNLAAAQSIDPNSSFTLTWNPMNNPGGNDWVVFFVENDFGRDLIETPDPGEIGVLAGSATSFTIPAGTLPPGRTYECELIFGKTTEVDSSDYDGVRGCASFAKVTSFEITTTGDPIVAELDMERVDQGQFKFRVLGEKRFAYTIESSMDLMNWTKLFSQSADDTVGGFLGSFEFTEYDTSNPTRRFYRASEGEFYGDNGNNGGDGDGGPQWEVVFVDDLDVTMCNGGTPTTFCCQRVHPDGFGNFSETWSPDTPILNVNGSLNDTTFSATMQCTSGGMMGNMTATKSGSIYQGTFNFHNSGTVFVLPLTDKISVHGRAVVQGTGTPIAGAAVTTTIGGMDTTDADGFFYIVTDEPVKDGVGEPFPYAIDLTKAGFSGAGGVAVYGDHAAGLRFEMEPFE